jgi:hypothetical protein
VAPPWLQGSSQVPLLLLLLLLLLRVAFVNAEAFKLLCHLRSVMWLQLGMLHVRMQCWLME